MRCPASGGNVFRVRMISVGWRSVMEGWSMTEPVGSMTREFALSLTGELRQDVIFDVLDWTDSRE